MEKAKSAKKVICSILVVIFIFAGINTDGFTSEAKSGRWMQDSTGYYYKYSDGTYAKSEWLNSGGKWYHFNAKGYMQTGWQKLANKWYYFGTDGAMKTGWLKNGGKWYFFNTSGIMQTGWLKSGSNWYYFNSSGIMQTGWQKISNKWYYFNSSGIMLVNQKIGDYYVGADGAMTTEPQSGGGTTKPVGSRVWVAGSGKGTKYHSVSTCSNMKNPVQISYEEAVKKGYQKCTKCY